LSFDHDHHAAFLGAGDVVQRLPRPSRRSARRRRSRRPTHRSALAADLVGLGQSVGRRTGWWRPCEFSITSCSDSAPVSGSRNKAAALGASVPKLVVAAGSGACARRTGARWSNTSRSTGDSKDPGAAAHGQLDDAPGWGPGDRRSWLPSGSGHHESPRELGQLLRPEVLEVPADSGCSPAASPGTSSWSAAKLPPSESAQSRRAEA